MIAKLERDFIAADLSSVENLLTEMTPSDFVARRALEGRRDELQSQLASVTASEQTLASAALFFGGQPVISNKGIESEFGASVIGTFQDIVAKVAAGRRYSLLGQRGPVSDKDESKLHITNIVRGSFGFEFQELADQGSILNSELKEAVDEAVKLMVSFDDSGADLLNESVESIDNRILDTIRKFFGLLHDGHATFRIVAANVDRSYDRLSVERAMQRASVTTIEENEVAFSGRLVGLLPQHRAFEYVTETGDLLYGKVDKSLQNDAVSRFLQDWYERKSHARIRVKRILRPGRDPLTAYFLLNISNGSAIIR